MQQRRRIRAAHAKFQHVLSVDISNLNDGPAMARCRDGAGITILVGDFDPRDGACSEEMQQVRPVIRRSIRESEHDFIPAGLAYLGGT